MKRKDSRKSRYDILTETWKIWKKLKDSLWGHGLSSNRKCSQSSTLFKQLISRLQGIDFKAWTTQKEKVTQKEKKKYPGKKDMDHKMTHLHKLKYLEEENSSSPRLT